MKKLFNVAKGAFRPPPKVESAVVRMEPLTEILNIDEDLLRRAFSARRKTLRNALPGVDFAAAGIDPGSAGEPLARGLRAPLDELDLVAVGILDEGDDRGAALHRAGFARDLAAGAAHRAHAAATSGTLDGDVAEGAADLVRSTP